MLKFADWGLFLRLKLGDIRRFKFYPLMILCKTSKNSIQSLFDALNEKLAYFAIKHAIIITSDRVKNLKSLIFAYWD